MLTKELQAVATSVPAEEVERAKAAAVSAGRDARRGGSRAGQGGVGRNLLHCCSEPGGVG